MAKDAYSVPVAVTFLQEGIAWQSIPEATAAVLGTVISDNRRCLLQLSYTTLKVNLSPVLRNSDAIRSTPFTSIRFRYLLAIWVLVVAIL